MQKNSKRKLKVIGVVIIVAIGLLAWYVWPKAKQGGNEIQPTQTPIATPVPTTATPIATPTPLEFTDAPPAGYEGFFEKTPVIGGQQAYVAYPKTVDPANPPTIIMYYHGSTQRITTDFKNNQVMKDMRAYGAYMTKSNFVFVASNQHGDNYGSAQSVNDSEAVIAWIRKSYPVQSKIMVLGFSMGGAPAIKHVLLYPTHVSKLALLAPVNQDEIYKAADYAKIKTVPMTIWHGTADVNVPYSATQTFMKNLAKYKIVPTLHALKGKVHWDVDTEYMSEIKSFYLD